MNVQHTVLAMALMLGVSGLAIPAHAGGFEATPLLLAQEPNAPERTYMTPQNDDQIAVQISDGEFFFRGILTRSSGNVYIAHDRQVRVIYDREVGRVVVINIVTGTEFYNYPYRDNQRNTSEGAL
ncbi:MAG: hypothetical protein HY785_16995 [Oscillatoriophycideae cyanobacterium NC_groundwater_1537_Pr4_S-0.65um_50_18]|nr:hypothetical protein [Oscillatoriophycideae cyanobacterium NC_groundwater_1537_Pr4_S-0.65um_50_18]